MAKPALAHYCFLTGSHTRPVLPGSESSEETPGLRRNGYSCEARPPFAGAERLITRRGKSQLGTDTKDETFVLEQRQIEQIEIPETGSVAAATPAGCGSDRQRRAQDLWHTAEQVR